MKKYFLYSILAFMAILLFAQSPSLEAREHRRSTRIAVNVGAGAPYPYQDTYVVRRYARPVVYRPVYVAPAPVYVIPAPAYVEEVRVAPAPRPFSFAGLSFSWNFFR